jgi:hypothetical protein
MSHRNRRPSHLRTSLGSFEPEPDTAETVRMEEHALSELLEDQELSGAYDRARPGARPAPRPGPVSGGTWSSLPDDRPQRRSHSIEPPEPASRRAPMWMVATVSALAGLSVGVVLLSLVIVLVLTW